MASEAADRACVPGTAAANVPLRIDVSSSTVCLSCFASLEACEVAVSGSQITVAMRTKTCPPAGDGMCDASCQMPTTSCTLPALAAGTYTVKVFGESGDANIRQLVVSSESTKSSCKLDPPGNVPDLDASRYAKNCGTDTDCKLVTSATICGPCACPNLAIATSSLPAFESDYRERLSQCGRKSPVACAPCPPKKAVCDTSTGLTGTCVVKSDA